MVAFFATAMLTGCDKDESSSSSGSGSSELANTSWQLNSPDDELYHTDVVYHLVFGPTNQVTYTVIVGTDYNIMSGTYEFSNGNGTAYMTYQDRPDDTNEYRFTFTYDGGDTIIWHVSARDITLTKLQ